MIELRDKHDVMAGKLEEQPNVDNILNELRE